MEMGRVLKEEGAAMVKMWPATTVAKIPTTHVKWDNKWLYMINE